MTTQPVDLCSVCNKPLGLNYTVVTKSMGRIHKNCDFGINLERAGHDPVNHPTHYTDHPSGIECIQVTRHMTFNLGNAVKYLWRAGKKDPTIQDLEKARWYILDEIIRLKRAQGVELTEEEKQRK